MACLAAYLWTSLVIFMDELSLGGYEFARCRLPGLKSAPFVELLLQQFFGGQVELILPRFTRPTGSLRLAICAALRFLGVDVGGRSAG